MGKLIYLIRHGQTDYNLKGIVQGSGVDASLNQAGRKQAESFYQKYKDIPFKKIYTSVLKRTAESVEGFIKMGIPWEQYEGLNEISWGEKDGKIINAEDDIYFNQIISEWKKGNTHIKAYNGESPDEVSKRINEAMDVIISKEDEDIILICMHGRAMRILMASLIHNNLSCMDDFHHHNLCLYILKYESGKYIIEKNNDIEHLNNGQC